MLNELSYAIATEGDPEKLLRLMNERFDPHVKRARIGWETEDFEGMNEIFESLVDFGFPLLRSTDANDKWNNRILYLGELVPPPPPAPVVPPIETTEDGVVVMIKPRTSLSYDPMGTNAALASRYPTASTLAIQTIETDVLQEMAGLPPNFSTLRLLVHGRHRYGRFGLSVPSDRFRALDFEASRRGDMAIDFATQGPDPNLYANEADATNVDEDEVQTVLRDMLRVSPYDDFDAKLKFSATDRDLLECLRVRISLSGDGEGNPAFEGTFPATLSSAMFYDRVSRAPPHLRTPARIPPNMVLPENARELFCLHRNPDDTLRRKATTLVCDVPTLLSVSEPKRLNALCLVVRRRDTAKTVVEGLSRCSKLRLSEINFAISTMGTKAPKSDAKDERKTSILSIAADRSERLVVVTRVTDFVDDEAYDFFSHLEHTLHVILVCFDASDLDVLDGVRTAWENAMTMPSSSCRHACLSLVDRQFWEFERRCCDRTEPNRSVVLNADVPNAGPEWQNWWRDRMARESFAWERFFPTEFWRLSCAPPHGWDGSTAADANGAPFSAFSTRRWHDSLVFRSASNRFDNDDYDLPEAEDEGETRPDTD